LPLGRRRACAWFPPRWRPLPRAVQSRGTVRGGLLLYFAYDANIEPSRLSQVAPQAEFRFIAHLPEWRLHFPIPNGSGGLPSVRPEAGNTVWGAVFSVPDPDLAQLNAKEQEEGRVPTTTQAMDREGRRHDVLVHICSNEVNGEFDPERPYLEAMVAGSRHWKLPAGWVACLEEHLEAI
jgi:cation transport regulator ChaC